jgi:hypothetical protein
MLRVAFLLGLVLALAGLGLIACGGSDRLSAKDYRAQLAVVVKSRHQDTAVADLKKLGKAKSGATIRKGLVTFAAEHELFAGEVGKLKPPKDAQKANDLLARGARDLTLQVRETVSRLTVSKRPEAARKQLDALGTGRGAREEATALSQLKKLGYIKKS